MLRMRVWVWRRVCETVKVAVRVVGRPSSIVIVIQSSPLWSSLLLSSSLCDVALCCCLNLWSLGLGISERGRK